MNRILSAVESCFGAAGSKPRPVEMLGSVKASLFELLIDKNTSQEERFIAYVIHELARDAILNLTGDFPYDDESGKKAYEMRNSALVLMADELSRNLSRKDAFAFEDGVRLCVSLTKILLDCFAELEALPGNR